MARQAAIEALFIGGSSAADRIALMNKSIALGLAALLALGASPATAMPHDDLVRLGQTLRIDQTSIRPIRVIEDSRCPANARCIWGGRVVVRADVRTGRYRQRIDLTLGEARHIANRTITLTSVEPIRFTNSVLRPGNYRLGFTLTP